MHIATIANAIVFFSVFLYPLFTSLQYKLKMIQFLLSDIYGLHNLYIAIAIAPNSIILFVLGMRKIIYLIPRSNLISTSGTCSAHYKTYVSYDNQFFNDFEFGQSKSWFEKKTIHAFLALLMSTMCEYIIELMNGIAH